MAELASEGVPAEVLKPDDGAEPDERAAADEAASAAPDGADGAGADGAAAEEEEPAVAAPAPPPEPQGQQGAAAEDPALVLPVPSRPDWDTEMQTINAYVQDSAVSIEEKVRMLHEALVQRIEDVRDQEETKAVSFRRLDETSKEKERCRAEVQRALSAKVKLEGSCRDLQQQKSNMAKENQRITEEEQSRHSELKEKFQQAIKDVQEKMDAELEVRQHFLKENEELRGKLLKFTERYEAQEKQLAEQREARGREMEVAQQRLKEHESMCSASKANTAVLEKQNEVLRKSQVVLRDELQSILGKFDEFHEAVAGSNQRHGECKVEIDGLQSRLQDLEKENTELRNGSQLTQLTQEQQVAQKQRDALERLCDNLQKENKKLQEQLRSIRASSSKT